VPLVLVVEDHPVMANAVRDLIADLGYVTRVAHTLDGARKFLESFHPDCIVLDVGLPDGDAPQLLHEMTRQKSTTPTVLMSAAPRARSVANTFGVPLVSKPIDPERLIASVQVAIEGRMKPVQPRN
jgi:DNA-binding response OmpR family regulator